jgi:hypothetical protein
MPFNLCLEIYILQHIYDRKESPDVQGISVRNILEVSKDWFGLPMKQTFKNLSFGAIIGAIIRSL